MKRIVTSDCKVGMKILYKDSFDNIIIGEIERLSSINKCPVLRITKTIQHNGFYKLTKGYTLTLTNLDRPRYELTDDEYYARVL